MNDMDFVMPDTFTAALFPPSSAVGVDVLVADDDPASRRFFADGMRRLDARVVTCADGIEALALARDRAFDLLLLDCRMPGAGALQVVPSLRRDARARSRHSIAVASSAEMTSAGRAALLAAGFTDVLVKPCKLADLQRLLQLLPDRETMPLDDRAALLASGDQATMQALRGLLRDELELLRDDISPVGMDRTALAERLHRLRSSCGFCGATMLSTETIALQAALAHAPADLGPCLQRFSRALEATLLALDA